MGDREVAPPTVDAVDVEDSVEAKVSQSAAAKVDPSVPVDVPAKE